MRLVSWVYQVSQPTLTFSDFTSPIFFWTNIELSLGVVSACLPTLRPIWTFFRQPQTLSKLSTPLYSLSGSGSRYGCIQNRTHNTHLSEQDDIGLTSKPGVETFVEGHRFGTSRQPSNAITVDHSITSITRPQESV